jgi:hypothetical protein
MLGFEPRTKMKRFILSILSAGLCFGMLSCTKQDRLSQWEKEVSRPNFRLLDSAQNADYLIAVYDTGKDEIAFCYKWVGNGPKPVTHSLAIHDDQGGDLGHGAGKPTTDLLRKRSCGVPSFLEYRQDGLDGIVYPVRSGYRGSLSVAFGEGSPKTGVTRRVYEKRIASR